MRQHPAIEFADKSKRWGFTSSSALVRSAIAAAPKQRAVDGPRVVARHYKQSDTLERVCDSMREKKFFRDPEAREKARIVLEEIIELYNVSDPLYGRPSEDEKLENARKSITLFWELFDILAYWAQCQIIAYCRSNFDKEFRRTMNIEDQNIHTGSHVLEQAGDKFLQSISAKFMDKDLNYFDDEKQYFSKGGAFSQILREFIFEMLASNSGDSHPWRFILQRGVRAMNAGQTEDIFEPLPVRRSGTPFDLAEWKHEALLQVYFRSGQGYKKYRALEIVGTGIAQSVETLRDWEKGEKFNEEYLVELECAQIAGRHEGEFKAGTDIKLGFHHYGTHRGTPLIEIAFSLMRVIESRSFPEIAANIYKFRQR
jgi:hypothetical protein